MALCAEGQLNCPALPCPCPELGQGGAYQGIWNALPCNGASSSPHLPSATHPRYPRCPRYQRYPRYQRSCACDLQYFAHRLFLFFCCPSPAGEGEAVHGAEEHPGPPAGARGRGAALHLPGDFFFAFVLREWHSHILLWLLRMTSPFLQREDTYFQGDETAYSNAFGGISWFVRYSTG